MALSPLGEEVNMPWKERSVMDEGFQFVASRRGDGVRVDLESRRHVRMPKLSSCDAQIEERRLTPYRTKSWPTRKQLETRPEIAESFRRR